MKVVILGAGVSGRAAERLALALGQEPVILCDGSEVPPIPACDLIVASPGLNPLESPLYARAAASGVEMISEMEYAFRNLGATPVLAVTGTNGKTTTTELVTHILNRLGHSARYAGNIGVPLAEFAADAAEHRELPEVLVVEVSNFQLELVKDFAPRAAVLLNLASDHENRYRRGFAEYCEIKQRIFEHVAPEFRVWGASFRDKPHRVTCEGDTLRAQGRALCSVPPQLGAAHNRENLAAAVELAACYLGGWDFDWAAAVADFNPGRHRIEQFLELDGIRYVDDSKGTNPHAVAAAVRAVAGPVVLLLGGLDKAMDFALLRELAPRVRKAIVFGECRARILAAVGGMMECEECGSDFELAVRRAVASAHPGDCVMLSPACASMDMFKNYQERGERFKELCRKYASLRQK